MTSGNQAVELWPPRVLCPIRQPIEYSNQPVGVRAHSCAANINLLPYERPQLAMLPHLRDDQQMPVMTLCNDKGHGWDAQIA